MRKLSALFTSLALGATLLAAPGLAGAQTSPTSACKAESLRDESIIGVFQTRAGQKAFANDGCVYGVIVSPGKGPGLLPIQKYNLGNEADANKFFKAYTTAETENNREAARENAVLDREAQRRQREIDQRRRQCDAARSRAIGNTVGNILRGRDPINPNDAAYIARYCGPF